MRNFLFFILFLLSTLTAGAQSVKNVSIGEEQIFVQIDNNHRKDKIQVFDFGGQLIGSSDIPKNASCITGGNDEIFVTINHNHRTSTVLRLNREGEQTGAFEVDGEVSSISLRGDEVFVQIDHNHRILRYSRNGEFLGEISF